MIFLSDCFWHLKRKMHKDFKKNYTERNFRIFRQGNFHASQMSLRRIYQFFSDDSFQSYYYIETLKRRGHRTIFHAKAFVSLAIPTHVLAHLKIRILKDAHDLLRLQPTIACARASSYCIRSQTFTNVYCSESHSAAV